MFAHQAQYVSLVYILVLLASESGINSTEKLHRNHNFEVANFLPTIQGGITLEI
jgi:hypothetical protein